MGVSVKVGVAVPVTISGVPLAVGVSNVAVCVMVGVARGSGANERAIKPAQ